MVHLGATGHCRLGVGSHKQEMEAPCGYTDASYGFRDVDGSKVHKSSREAYAAGYKEGDVVGCALGALRPSTPPLSEYASVQRIIGLVVIEETKLPCG